MGDTEDLPWLRLSVAPPAEDGRATEAALRLLAESLGIRARQVRLVAGERRRDKIVEVDLDAVTLRRRILDLPH